MAEYIEREALLDEINTAPVSMSICMNVDECKGRIYERERLVRIINAAPAADVVPVVRSEWIYDNWDRQWTCLNCMRSFSFLVVENAKEEWDYCPNCGALMDKDGDGE